MRTVEIETRYRTRTEVQEKVVHASIRALRLVALSALLAMLAGTASRVYAQSATAATEVATVVDGPANLPPDSNPSAQTAPAAATDQTAAQPQAAEPVYQVLPPEMLPAEPNVKVVAQSSVPPEASPLTAAAAKDGKKGKKKKEKAPKLTPVKIEEGTLTIDGWTGKARLNYDIADLKYVYIWAPGIGTIVASNQKFPLGSEQKNAFSGNTLTLEANGHTVQISSENKLLKEKKPVSAWVYIDTIYKAGSRYPEMGYGLTKDAPYAWPGAKDAPVEKGVVGAPPLPAGMRPAIAKPNCLPAGAASTTGVAPTATACPAGSAKPSTPPAGPAAAPPVPLPGYTSGTTTAEASPAPKVPAAH